MLLLRPWVEGADLRVRVVEVRGEHPATTVGVAADVDSACDIVRDWLSDLLAQSTPLR